MTNLTATSELAAAILHFETALNVVLGHMGQRSVSLSAFYACECDMVAKLSFSTNLQPYEFDRFVKVAMSHISANTKLSDRVRDLDAQLNDDCIFFQV